jgi:hypothetical protein
MAIARRFNAGLDAEIIKVPKGRLNGPHVLLQISSNTMSVTCGLDALGRPFGTNKLSHRTRR